MPYIAAVALIILTFSFVYLFWKFMLEPILNSQAEILIQLQKRDESFLKEFTTILETVKTLQIEKDIEERKTVQDFNNTLLKAQKEFLDHAIPIIKESQLRQAPNPIEKKEPEEIPLSEEIKIPIMNGMKVQFEDEESILTPFIQKE